ncbi:MAG: DNA polymerase IV [Bacteroidetes bacterium]|nr:DNA polymerase IV [Bacteroidota bacterium]HET6244538.1 DNA polymerase IV [Bacteroidia bacterium]
MERTVVHMDLDSFFVSVERLMDSSLFGKPVIIGGTSDRGVVASCSYEARKFGVHSAMPAKMARQLCPHAIFVRGDMDTYSKYSKLVTQIIENEAPLVEKASIDEHYLDITGMDRYIKNSMQWTHELRQKIIKETGLPISYGLSVNKTVSKIATGEAKPNGEKNIDPGIEKLFLAPLSIKKIPGIGDKTYLMLRNMGIEKVETIQQMPLEIIQKVLGENGGIIWRKANGVDNSPVAPYSEQKSMSSERTFDKDTTDIEQLKKTLITMIEGLAFDLRKSKKVTGCVTLKLRYSDFQTHTFQSRIAYTASDHVLLDKTLELFKKNYTRRVLIRLIGVKFSHLVSGQTQISLFDDTEEMINLYQSLDRIRLRFGVKAIMRSVGLDLKK